MKHIVINIGRQFGCGGLEVARVLGQKLGIPVYDNELITKAAQESGFSAALFKESDETRTSFSFRNWFGVNSSNDYTSQGGLFKIQSDTIKSIAEQGSAIIVGRCADYILRGNKNTLNVFLTASEESRIERISRREGISKENAEEMLKKKDKERADYYNYYTFGNWGVASTYDLCLDSSKIGIEGTADLIIDFARRANLL